MATTQHGRAAVNVDTAGDAIALGQAAYQRIRAREFAAARPLIERALSLAPENAILAHTKAHLCIDSGAFAEGAAYLRLYLSTHDPFAGVNVHTAWHLAYIELELGRRAAALDWHRRVVVPTLSPQTFYSAASLLWRLEVLGYGRDALRPDWAALHTAALGLLDSADPSHLDDLGRAMLFIATGDEPHLARLLERVGAGPDDPLAAEVVRPLIHGLSAYWRGDFAGALDRIGPITPSLGRLSEFTDQIGVVHDTLQDARTRALAAAGTDDAPSGSPPTGSP